MYTHIDNPNRLTRTLPDRARLPNGDLVLALPAADTATREACGWYEVAAVPEPTIDTARQRTARSIEVIDGRPTVVWAVTDKTADELAADTQRAADETERAQIRRAVRQLDRTIRDGDPLDPELVARILRRLIIDQFGDDD